VRVLVELARTHFSYQRFGEGRRCQRRATTRAPMCRICWRTARLGSHAPTPLFGRDGGHRDVQALTPLQSVVWSGASRPAPITVRIDRTNPSVCRKGNRKTGAAWRRSRSPHPRTAAARTSRGRRNSPAALASGASHSVTSPRRTSACCYAREFPP